MSQRSSAKRSPPTDSQSEEDEETQPADSADLQFINFTDFDQTTTPETKKKVRSHVMHRVQQNLRSGKRRTKEGEIVLDISLLSQDTAGSTRDPATSMSGPLVAPHPSGLGAGRSDPFARYPIDMNVRTHELFDHVHGKTCPMFKTLSKIGFFKIILDDAAFRQVLCTSSAHMTMLRGGTENAEAIALSTKAIQSLNKRIADPVLAVSDGVIVTVLAFACHAVMFNDLQGSLTHFSGLEEIIRRRGGLSALRSNPVVRTVLFWLDINTAFLHDRIPRFPIPEDILPKINLQPFISLSDRTLLEACLTEDMISAVNELLGLNQFIASELAVRDLWDDGVFAGLHVVPLLSKLLSIRYETLGSTPPFARQEACRIGALLYLAGIRHRFGVGLKAGVYIPKLKDVIIAQDGSNLETTDPILLWVLFLGGVQSLRHAEHKWYISAIADLIVRRQWSMWEQLMAIVHQVLWVEGILEVECEEFRREVSAESWSSYGHLFSY